MRFNTAFLLLGSLLAFASHTLALSIRVDAGALAARASAVAPVQREVVAFTPSGSEVMPPHDAALVRRVGWTYRKNQTLLLAVIAKNAYIISASCGSGNVVTCAIGATYSVLTFFFAAWFFADRRALEGADGVPHFVFGPTPDLTLRARVETEIAPGQWHYLGHVSQGGLNHTVHYYGHGGGCTSCAPRRCHSGTRPPSTGASKTRATTAASLRATTGTRLETGRNSVRRARFLHHFGSSLIWLV
ncbi:hypothetical protein PsYK624_066620 [Phanerochaete sordida]|uniref:Uncharacterized protein n=1 Tax=Phanerochaete sordida TaxID=48140 RepID=A0A9P3LE21_9APHY|nr:hypothetical protein PsYK624_066620 [Phanerochaete sordida]